MIKFRDNLLFLPEHKEKARKAVDYFLEYNHGGTIGLFGRAGSGKSEIAWHIHRILYNIGLSSHVVPLDRYYMTAVDEREAWRRKHQYVGPAEMNWPLVFDEVSAFTNNNIDVVIFEGLYAGYIPCLSCYVYVEAGDTYKFRKERGKEDPDSDFRRWTLEHENEAVDRVLKRVDIRV